MGPEIIHKHTCKYHRYNILHTFNTCVYPFIIIHLFMQIYISIRAYMHTRLHAYPLTCIPTYMHTHLHAYIPRIHTRIYTPHTDMHIYPAYRPAYIPCIQTCIYTLHTDLHIYPAYRPAYITLHTYPHIHTLHYTTMYMVQDRIHYLIIYLHSITPCIHSTTPYYT
jgi:hypothetical protein